MNARLLLPSALILLALGLSLALAGGAVAQRQAGAFESAQDSRQALNQALRDREAAQARAGDLEQLAQNATQAADRASAQAAAMAARIQESEAGIAAATARLDLINAQRRVLAARLAERQQPLMHLTGALQQLSRRPLGLSVLRPGSVREMVYLRAMMATTLPEVRRRTAALRREIDRAQALQRDAARTLTARREQESLLRRRQTELSTMASRQRLASRQASGVADREAERALALAEEARDLDALVTQLDRAGSLRAQLAALPGPILRPDRPGVTTNAPAAAAATPSLAAAAALRPPCALQLPVTGRTVTGFGTPTPAGTPSRGLSLAPRAGALVVAPCAGRVAFAGAFAGYGQILIIEHAGGWTSLITGLARVDAQVGDQVLGGAPLGMAGPGRPVVGLELRRDGQVVNPVEFLR